MNKDDLIVVCGAGGFIGGHLVKRLVEEGYYVRAIDRKHRDQWHQFVVPEEVFDECDLSECFSASGRADIIFNLAAEKGGIGYIQSHRADCMLSSLVNTHLLLAAKENKVKRYFYASSACIYPKHYQGMANPLDLAEQDAYPADCEDGYGWEKLFGERMCKAFKEDYGVETRVARLFNTYGPHCEYEGERACAPAAICAKVVRAKLMGADSIEIWGDGEQTRSFTFIDDCIRGILDVTNGNYSDPVNLGSSELVSINQLVDAVEAVAGTKLKRVHKLDAPTGVRGRNSDNTEFKRRYGWEPSIKLANGIEKTYRWIYDQIAKSK